MRQHITRDYNSFEINKPRGIISKLSKEDRLKDEIDYYRNIDDVNSIFFPRFFDSDDPGVLNLEYYAYNNLGDYMIYQDFDSGFWEQVVDQIKCVLDSFGKNCKHGNFSDFARKMYIDKTEHYYNDLIQNFDKFKIISDHKTLKFNGKSYLNFEEIWDNIKGIIEEDLLPLDTMQVIHGDFCFSNVMCGVNEKTDTCLLKCVDPRGRFGEKGIYGDVLYDIGKLRHSYEGGYEYIIYDEFDLRENGTSEFEVSFSNNNLHQIAKVFNNHSIFNSREVKLIQGLIYIGMCSRHYDSVDRQTVMYNQGIKFLNEVLNDE